MRPLCDSLLVILLLTLIALLALMGDSRHRTVAERSNQRSLGRSDTQSHPVYQLEYEVSYATTESVGSAGNDCQKFYAQVFLEKFISLQSWFDLLCESSIRDDRNGASAGKARVQVYPIVHVHVFDREIKIVTQLNVSSRSNVDAVRNDILACSDVLHTQLQTPALLEAELTRQRDSETLSNGSTRASQGRHIMVIGNAVCKDTRMEPNVFRRLLSSWACRDNQTLDVNDSNWRCISASHQEQHSLSTKPQSLVSPLPRTRPLPGVHLPPSTSSHRYNSYGRLTQADNLGVSSTPAVVLSSTERPVYTGTDVSRNQWGINVLKSQNIIYVHEGDRASGLPLRVSYNSSSICGDHPVTDCDISLEIAFVPVNFPVEPTCRRTSRPIAQFVVSRPTGPDSLQDGSGAYDYCSIKLPHDTKPSSDVQSSADVHVYFKATLDQKYDGHQVRNLTLTLVRRVRVGGNARVRGPEVTEYKREVLREIQHRVQVQSVDRDTKATCQSINDPHVTTFDGLEYNNFYEGEFILYKHKILPFSVQVIYQKCHGNINASCNCAVAVQSGDDVLVIDRCVRAPSRVKLPQVVRPGGEGGQTEPTMFVQLYLNGILTPGTQIYRDSYGKKYIVFLPHGAHIKVIVSGGLINVWLVPSPNDLHLTEGLCGSFDWIRRNDIHLRNGTIIEDPALENISAERQQPDAFIQDWRVNMTNGESLFHGLPPSVEDYKPTRYCECEQGVEGATVSLCGYAIDVNNCDVYEGDNITEFMIRQAISPKSAAFKTTRKKRGIDDNSINPSLQDDPIIVDRKFKSPKYRWKNGWNDVIASKYCRQYIKDNYTIGPLCGQIPTVNFKQEITTCVEDIQITGNTSWADSARGAMKEQCIEEVQKNGSLPQSLVDGIRAGICDGDCSGHGVCVDGHCRCNVGYRMASDCSVADYVAPSMYRMAEYGLCDMRYMDCSKVIVFGSNFVKSENLTCHLEEVKVTDKSYVPVNNSEIIRFRAVFVNFQEVQCPISVMRSYLIRVSNNGLNTSDSLLFIPFDSACSTCFVLNTTCVKTRNSCIIDGKCYQQDERSETDHCLVCKGFDDEFQWTTVSDSRCRPSWWEDIQLPDWVVALVAAVGGSLIGIVVGFLLYKCCCRSLKSTGSVDLTTQSGDRASSLGGTYYDSSLLHRSRVVPAFSSDPFADLEVPQGDTPGTTFLFNDGRGIETGLDSTTYF